MVVVVVVVVRCYNRVYVVCVAVCVCLCVCVCVWPTVFLYGSVLHVLISVLVDLRRVAGVDTMADKALIGYLKIIAELNRNRQVLRTYIHTYIHFPVQCYYKYALFDSKVLSYRKEPRLTENGTHEFKVRMGFGTPDITLRIFLACTYIHTYIHTSTIHIYSVHRLACWLGY